MNRILILGAGRSCASLIRYLLIHAPSHDWGIVVGDISEQAARDAVSGHARGAAVAFDIKDREASRKTIAQADVVISMLPAVFHPLVAGLCLDLEKHLFTASYVSDEMASYNSPAVTRNLLFLNECGLDPGIDHMSAMQVIDRIRTQGGSIHAFESFTGGLIDPRTDPENPWQYKFTWNPRNVVMAGQGTAKYLQDGQFKYIPYQQLFRRITPVEVPGLGKFEGYANRDSLKYIATYGLDGVKTMLRGTLRHPGFCEAWHMLVQLGCCDDSYQMEEVDTMTHLDFIRAFQDQSDSNDLYKRIQHLTGIHAPEALNKLTWSGLFSNELVGLQHGTPAQILEHILSKKWKLLPSDTDMIVMQHRFIYEIEGRMKNIHASLVSKGENSVHTAMAKTVGLPLAIATRLLLTGKIHARGVVIPVTPEFYDPILEELRAEGIHLVEEEFE